MQAPGVSHWLSLPMAVRQPVPRGHPPSAGELSEAPTAAYIFVDEVSPCSWVATNVMTRQRRKLVGCSSCEVVEDDDGDAILLGIDLAGGDKQVMLHEVPLGHSHGGRRSRLMALALVLFGFCACALISGAFVTYRLHGRTIQCRHSCHTRQ